MNYLLPSRDSGNTIRLMDAGQNEVIEEEDLPGCVNACFTGIGPKLASNFSDNWIPDLPDYQGNMIGPIQVRVDEIEKLVKDTCKASSVPYISTCVLKDTFAVISVQLCYMYNLVDVFNSVG